jgi:hypothetical protein
MTETLRPVFRTRPILLGGAPVYESLHTPESPMGIRIIKIIYDETSSADVGVEIRIGKIGSPSFFATYTSEASKAAGTMTILQQITSVLSPDETLTVECAGLKAGAGIVSVQIECYYTLIF